MLDKNKKVYHFLIKFVTIITLKTPVKSLKSQPTNPDTDGLWTDEWDVDMGVYEGHQGDKDARDTQEIRDSEQFRSFGDVDEKIGDFEKHTNVPV